MKNKSLIESALPEIREMEAKRMEYKLEIERCKDPLYFYNNYVRKEGDPEMTQELYDIHMSRRQDNAMSNRFRKSVEYAAIFKYPQPPEGCEL